MTSVLKSRILLAIHLIGIAWLIFDLTRMNWQLTSPLIPTSIKSAIEKPMIIALIISSVALIISLTSYFFRKYLLVITLSGLSIIYVFLQPIANFF